MITGSVAVCTRNRVALLQQCLASLDHQFAAQEQLLEILVVDNGSSDGTAAFLRRWQEGAPGRRVVTEPVAGLSRARNTALRSSASDVVLFLDDDALAPSAWASAHLDVYADDPGIGAVGGPIGLLWPDGRPGWIDNALASWFSELDLGDAGGPFPSAHGPFGTNMSVRREAALEVGAYNESLGRKGRSLISSEEPDLTRRLVAAGWSIAYEPVAAIVHQVSPERISRRWLLRRGWAQGISNVRTDALAAPSSRRAHLRLARTEVGEIRALLDGRKARPAGHRLPVTVVTLAHVAMGAEHVRFVLGRRGASTGSPR